MVKSIQTKWNIIHRGSMHYIHITQGSAYGSNKMEWNMHVDCTKIQGSTNQETRFSWHSRELLQEFKIDFQQDMGGIGR